MIISVLNIFESFKIICMHHKGNYIEFCFMIESDIWKSNNGRGPCFMAEARLYFSTEFSTTFSLEYNTCTILVI